MYETLTVVEWLTLWDDSGSDGRAGDCKVKGSNPVRIGTDCFCVLEQDTVSHCDSSEWEGLTVETGSSLLSVCLRAAVATVAAHNH